MDLVPELEEADRPQPAFIVSLTALREAAMNELVETVLGILGELYDQDIHLIDELIQNAEDAEASWVSFEVVAQQLTAANNGLPFSRGDIETITWVVKKRSKPPGKIGRHGIGFRSVYVVTNRPLIRSGDVAFAIEQALVPRPAPLDGASHWGTSFELPFKASTAKNGQAYPAFFASQISHFHPRMLLFLRSVWRLRLTVQAEANIELLFHKTEESHASTAGLLVKLYTNAQVGSEGADGAAETWLLFRDPPSGEITDVVEVAFRLEGSTISPCTDGFLHVFLPSHLRTDFPFLINGDFVPNKSRNGVLDDEPRNDALMRHAGELLAEAAPRLRSLVANAPARLLELMPRHEHAAQEPLFESLIEAAHERLVANRSTAWRRLGVSRGGRVA